MWILDKLSLIPHVIQYAEGFTDLEAMLVPVGDNDRSNFRKATLDQSGLLNP